MLLVLLGFVCQLLELLASGDLFYLFQVQDTVSGFPPPYLPLPEVSSLYAHAIQSQQLLNFLFWFRCSSRPSMGNAKDCSCPITTPASKLHFFCINIKNSLKYLTFTECQKSSPVFCLFFRDSWELWEHGGRWSSLMIPVLLHSRRVEWKAVNFMFNMVINDALGTHVKRRALCFSSCIDLNVWEFTSVISNES